MKKIRLLTIGILLICVFLIFLFSVAMGDELRFPLLGREAAAVSEEERVAADKLFNLAVEKANTNNGAESIQLIINALELNPNHNEIREMFGYRLHNNQWRTDWEIKKLADHVDHPRFGWLLKEHVKNYEAGKRTINRQQWMTIENEAGYRTKIQNGWKIFTPHYEIITNHSLEEGVARSRELEHLHNAWQLLTYGSLENESRIKSLFQKKATLFLPMQHKITIYRNKNDYVDDLVKIDSGIAKSNGYYFPKLKRAYFYAVSQNEDKAEIEAVRRVLLHEGSHQLFYEPRSSARPNELLGSRYNCWLVEGIAMFMETLRIEGKHYVLGNIADERLYAAKYNAQHLNFYVPFGRITKMGVNEFQEQKDLSKLYSQSAAMTHFLMFAEEGKYRKALLKLLKLIHNGTDKADSLAKLTDCSYSELDEKYKTFLEKIPEELP
ncbi:MAG: hypothetical protein LBJ00_02425 [Planctomycetaceae bacterium]|jgi:hypothetical protein|nr:hypothetical protein [Planctomycetaceae bacterium]